jgi:hypothetical protein
MEAVRFEPVYLWRHLTHFPFFSFQNYLFLFSRVELPSRPIYVGNSKSLGNKLIYCSKEKMTGSSSLVDLQTRTCFCINFNRLKSLFCFRNYYGHEFETVKVSSGLKSPMQDIMLLACLLSIILLPPCRTQIVS